MTEVLIFIFVVFVSQVPRGTRSTSVAWILAQRWSSNLMTRILTSTFHRQGCLTTYSLHTAAAITRSPPLHMEATTAPAPPLPPRFSPELPVGLRHLTGCPLRPPVDLRHTFPPTWPRYRQVRPTWAACRLLTTCQIPPPTHCQGPETDLRHLPRLSLPREVRRRHLRIWQPLTISWPPLSPPASTATTAAVVLV